MGFGDYSLSSSFVFNLGSPPCLWRFMCLFVCPLFSAICVPLCLTRYRGLDSREQGPAFFDFCVSRIGGPRFASLARSSISHIFPFCLVNLNIRKVAPSSCATFLIFKSEIGQLFTEISQFPCASSFSSVCALAFVKDIERESKMMR